MTTLSSAVESALGPHLDDDTREYVTSLLEDDPSDEDAREAVLALVGGTVEDDEHDPGEICESFFRLLDFGVVGDDGGGGGGGGSDDVPMRKLENAVTMKKHDVQSYASGLASIEGMAGAPSDVAEVEQQTQIASFYANMIDATNNPAAVSERTRRKERQKDLREKMEEEERQRAIKDAMAMMEGDGDDEGDGGDEGEGALSAADDNSADVHLRNFDLPNLRGGGPDLLSGANFTLASGRRYGLMGRNGCGKTTLMTYVAGRSIPGGVPKNMSMLLVRQEIMGNDWTAVETVLKSDVKREGVKKFIQWCEGELERLEKGDAAAPDGKEGEDGEGGKKGGSREEKAKGAKKKGGANRQKLRDRKKQGAAQRKKKSAASASKGAKVEEDVEARTARLTGKLSKAYQRLAQIEEAEGGDPEPRARKVLSGLGFSRDMQDKPTRELSGGWRMRVSLSCALFADPSLLLLDEPTNHLDLEAVLWLERYLTTKFMGTLVVVSHDRHFLNEVVTDVAHFYRSKLTTYRGDISNFEAVREEEKQRQIRLYETQEAKKAHLQKYIDLHAQAGENGVKASKQRKSRMKKLEKVGVMAQEGRRFKASYDGDAEEVEEYQEDEEVVLNFPDPGPYDGDIVKLERVTFGYDPAQILLKDVDLSIGQSSRIALLGRNGCGKSTLIKLVVGALQPVKGKSTVDGRARIEYLAQHQLEQLDPDGTPLRTMIDRYPGDRSNGHILELRRYLANFGLGGEILPKQEIRTMSGGQKCRLCLALAMYRKPHMLILDEPTNHLDLETTEALINAIKSFGGGVLLVSHDQHLLTSVCKHLIVVENGTVEELRGGTTNTEAFEAYKKAVVQGRR
mmetsp:Transcript_33748/g.100679  ORF Transcript_33748/g.100679 Transcript_33748/m.100679 type:complete len:851 (-) Transcript_33748:45-2597(-)